MRGELDEWMRGGTRLGICVAAWPECGLGQRIGPGARIAETATAGYSRISAVDIRCEGQSASATPHDQIRIVFLRL